MEQFRDIACAHYSAGPDQVKILAYDFFRKLDTDGDERVSLQEFVDFMNHQGHTRFANHKFFNELDRDGNGYLDFWEVLTLYYIIKSGRPVCGCCYILIPGTFFSCVECFDSFEGSYSLCFNCYRNKKSNHNHGGRQQFLDTFLLLETKKRPRPPTHHNHHHQLPPRPYQWQPAPALSVQSQAEVYTAHHHHQHQHHPYHHHEGSSTAIVPASRIETWTAALSALETGLTIGCIATTLCTIL